MLASTLNDWLFYIWVGLLVVAVLAGLICAQLDGRPRQSTPKRRPHK